MVHRPRQNNIRAIEIHRLQGIQRDIQQARGEQPIHTTPNLLTHDPDRSDPKSAHTNQALKPHNSERAMCQKIQWTWQCGHLKETKYYCEDADHRPEDPGPTYYCRPLNPIVVKPPYYNHCCKQACCDRLLDEFRRDCHGSPTYAANLRGEQARHAECARIQYWAIRSPTAQGPVLKPDGRTHARPDPEPFDRRYEDEGPYIPR